VSEHLENIRALRPGLTDRDAPLSWTLDEKGGGSVGREPRLIGIGGRKPVNKEREFHEREGVRISQRLYIVGGKKRITTESKERP